MESYRVGNLIQALRYLNCDQLNLPDQPEKKLNLSPAHTLLHSRRSLGWYLRACLINAHNTMTTFSLQNLKENGQLFHMTEDTQNMVDLNSRKAKKSDCLLQCAF